MALYTIIADYAGGTYLAQHRGASPRAALAKWAKDGNGTTHVVRRLRAAREALQRELAEPDNRPVRMAGLVGVWCTSASVGGRLLLINIIETRGTPNQRVAGNGAALRSQTRWARRA